VFSIPGLVTGLLCDRCQKPLGHVYRTKRSEGFKLREFVCPHCQAINTTSERVISSRVRE
jgi:hypothetical protein